MQSLFGRFARQLSSALLCAGAVFAAGCHHNNQTSGYGVGWVTLSDSPGDFTSYIVNVDSVTLTGKVSGVITAVATAETVDFTKLKDVSELWSSASIPNDTYTSATITLDYSAANISVMVDGVPVKAKVVNTVAEAVTTQTINITFDPNHPLVITPTYASTNAERVAIDFNLAASNEIYVDTSPPTVVVRPYMTVATSAPDNKPVRVRGPLINSSLGVSTYTVYVRPFFDEVNSLGSLTLFTGADTVYTINGSTYKGADGLSVLSQTSAGSTMTEAYTTYEPTATPSTTAGKFNANYVVAGSTLEDYYTQGLEGDVIARVGNTLTVRGATVQFNNGTSAYQNDDSLVLLGPNTIVTPEDTTTLTALNYNSISVGQHIIARGLYSQSALGIVTLDATGSSTNTGSVRLQSTELWGSVLGTGAGTLSMNVETIENWPASVFRFTGNGTGVVTPDNYTIRTTGATVPAGLAAGDPAWIEGISTPFGSAPPNFNAFTINTELSEPARIQVDWDTHGGTTAPFTQLNDQGIRIDLDNPRYVAGVIRIGSESIDLKSLAASPLIVPAPTPPATDLPAVFLPLFGVGGLTASDTTTITVFNTFSDYVTQLPKSVVAATPALHFTANGTFNRSNNTFTASRIDVVN